MEDNQEKKEPGLVITRKKGESFVLFVGDVEIDIVLRDIQNKKASIRIIAPKNVDIVRSELLEEYDD